MPDSIVPFFTGLSLTLIEYRIVYINKALWKQLAVNGSNNPQPGPQLTKPIVIPRPFINKMVTELCELTNATRSFWKFVAMVL